MTELTYQVDRNGQVISVKAMDGQPYQIKATKLEKMDWPHTIKADRWAAFKRVVAKQEPDCWMLYSGFANVKELGRAKSVLYRQKQDQFLKSALNGYTLDVRLNTITLELAVRKVWPDK